MNQCCFPRNAYKTVGQHHQTKKKQRIGTQDEQQEIVNILKQIQH